MIRVHFFQSIDTLFGSYKKNICLSPRSVATNYTNEMKMTDRGRAGLVTI